MHAILDAERDATMAYLDALVQKAGGRRGRARVTTETRGLLYAHTRHATSRAGDPCPHDHVLVANVVEMADEKGGFKALDTTVVRDHLHAATMVGRMAAARKALELGYAIEPDDGVSGSSGTGPSPEFLASCRRCTPRARPRSTKRWRMRATRAIGPARWPRTRRGM
jgi:conjugative relaxase-like TrwC/TraI family protein